MQGTGGVEKDGEKVVGTLGWEFQDRCLKPLGHPSDPDIAITEDRTPDNDDERAKKEWATRRVRSKYASVFGPVITPRMTAAPLSSRGRTLSLAADGTPNTTRSTPASRARLSASPSMPTPNSVTGTSAGSRPFSFSISRNGGSMPSVSPPRPPIGIQPLP